jgi:PIN domain nuclease of toxin-antitoxin system
LIESYLVDTGLVLVSFQAPERLTPETRSILELQVLYVSVVAYWEVLIKTMKGSLSIEDTHGWWIDSTSQLRASVLPIRAEHIGAIASLPPIHKDPFDRILMAQALVENLTLVTSDRLIPRYASERLKVRSILTDPSRIEPQKYFRPL